MILSALEGTSNAGSNSSSLLASPAALQGLFVELSEPLKFHQLRLSEKMRLFSALVSQNPSSADNHSFLSLRGIVVHYMFNILVHVCEATAEPSFQEKERKQYEKKRSLMLTNIVAACFGAATGALHNIARDRSAETGRDDERS